ncbi:MAG: diguanylate cyclase [Ruminococcaceae bacterium]|nr:diguanylate cyclase [Oscillospiraceae bacterium]
MLDLIKSRYSVKNYSDKQVPNEILEQIIEAGVYAPSGRNRQAVRFMVVQDKTTIEFLSKINAEVGGFPEGTDPFYNAPTVVVVFADRDVSTHVEDGSLALGNMLNVAFDLGVGSCWIHRAKQMFETSEGREIAREYGIPDSYIGIGNCTLGYGVDGEIRSPKERTQGRVHYKK